MYNGVPRRNITGSLIPPTVVEESDTGSKAASSQTLLLELVLMGGLETRLAYDSETESSNNGVPHTHTVPETLVGSLVLLQLEGERARERASYSIQQEHVRWL